jgi:arylsulfatase A-like enzyme
LFIVTSDHGENLTENGVFCGHSKLFDETTKVPLYWCDPEIKIGAMNAGLVQHADIYPSILERLVIEVPAHIRGKSLYPLMEGVRKKGHDFVFAEHANAYQYTIRTDEWQYIWKNTEKEHPHGLVLEDNFLISRTDSKNQDGYQNLAHQYPGVCRELRALGEETLSSPLLDDSESEAVPDAIVKVLRGLGYL